MTAALKGIFTLQLSVRARLESITVALSPFAPTRYSVIAHVHLIRKVGLGRATATNWNRL